MKNAVQLFLFVAPGLLFTGAGFGQATFLLQNRLQVYGINAPVFDDQATPLAGPNFAAELWGGATADALVPGLTVEASPQRVIIPFFTGVSSGYFQTLTPVSIAAVPAGGYAWLQVRAWDARLGADYEDVMALGLGGYGESPLFYARGSDPFREPPEPQAPLIGLQSFSLRPVPEPSAWALLAVGGLAVGWALRRQRPRKSA